MDAAPPAPKAAAKDAGSVTVVTISEPGSPSSGGDAAPGSPAPGGAAAAAAVPVASYFKLFSGADTLDWLLMVLGTVGGLGNGSELRAARNLDKFPTAWSNPGTACPQCSTMQHFPANPPCLFCAVL